jgi:hypothetical protein
MNSAFRPRHRTAQETEPELPTRRGYGWDINICPDSKKRMKRGTNAVLE